MRTIMPAAVAWAITLSMSAAANDFSGSWTSWRRGCSADALTTCLRKTAGTTRQVALEMAYQCKVRFDKGFRFRIVIDRSGASLAHWLWKDDNFRTYNFKHHRARLSIHRVLLVDEATGGEIVDGDFRPSVSENTNRHIFESANQLLADKGICEQDFSIPKRHRR